MARVVQTVPKQYRDDGVWYVVDIDDNQEIWRRYRDLCEIDRELKPSELEALRGLEAEVEGLFMVRIQPYSHQEYQEARAKHLERTSFQIDKKRQKAVLDKDPTQIAEAFAQAVVRTRCLEVRNYGGHSLDESGKPITYEPSNGEDLVEFIMTQCDPSEQAVIDDIYQAISSMSHLEEGRKKALRPPHTS